MAHEVLMPKLSSTMAEGTITHWLKEEGDSVEVGEAIFEVMTDKIAIEVEAYEEGILLKKYLGDGDRAPVNSIIAYIGETGEKVPEEMPTVEAEPLLVTEEAVQPKKTEAAPQSALPDNVKIRATPAARRIAREKGLDLFQVTGSGPKGRIQANDVKNYKTAAVAGENSVTRVIPWAGMRQVISERMTYSKTTIPHVTLNAQVEMSEAAQMRSQLLPMIEEQTGHRLSYLEIIAKATMVALKEFPIFNANALDDGIHVYEEVNLGLAVAVPDGLMVPVIKNASQMGLAELTTAVKELTQRTRNGQLMPEEMQGGTFSISSLGRTRVQTFNPIINAPEVAILGIGGITKEWVKNGDRIDSVPMLNLSLSFDHRAVDGAPAAAFLSRICELLETPVSMLL